MGVVGFWGIIFFFILKFLDVGVLVGFKKIELFNIVVVIIVIFW